MEDTNQPVDWLRSWDTFQVHSAYFRDDVESLVLSPVQAALARLDREALKAMSGIAPANQELSEEDREMFSEKKSEIEERAEDQKRFQRNMALVALLARLTYTLKRLSQLGEQITPRKKGSYRAKGARDSEFMELFREYRERFQIDLIGEDSGRATFLEPLRRARNKIVHEGGRANPFKHSSEVNLVLGDEGFLDMSFSKEVPQLVEGGGSAAQVNISEKQLHIAAASCFELVEWVAAKMCARSALSGNVAGRIQQRLHPGQEQAPAGPVQTSRHHRGRALRHRQAPADTPRLRPIQVIGTGL